MSLPAYANGLAVPVEALVYSVAEDETSAKLPEESEHERMWVSM